jgi:putative spermidine/putrescine transport system permease protein
MMPRLRAWAPALPALVVIGALFGGALLGAARTSVEVDPLGGGGFGLAAWRQALADPAFWRAARFTAWTALAGTALAVVLAVGAAVALRGRRWARALATLPVLVPHLLVAVVAVLWLGPGGLADRALGGLPFDVVRAGSGAGIILVYVVKEVPFLALLLLATWNEAVTTREEAAAVHGAGPLARLVLVVLPALKLPLVIGTTVVAAYLLGSFEVPLLLGPTSPDTLATYALRARRTADLSGRSVAAAVLLLTTLGSLAVAAVAASVVRRDRA